MDPSNLPLNYLLDENIPALLEVIVRKVENKWVFEEENIN